MANGGREFLADVRVVAITVADIGAFLTGPQDCCASYRRGQSVLFDIGRQRTQTYSERLGSSFRVFAARPIPTSTRSFARLTAVWFLLTVRRSQFHISLAPETDRRGKAGGHSDQTSLHSSRIDPDARVHVRQANRDIFNMKFGAMFDSLVLDAQRDGTAKTFQNDSVAENSLGA
jgi:hypothetical protein